MERREAIRRLNLLSEALEVFPEIEHVLGIQISDGNLQWRPSIHIRPDDLFRVARDATISITSHNAKYNKATFAADAFAMFALIKKEKEDEE